MDAKYVLEICILFWQILVDIKTIGDGAGIMTDDRRITKVFKAVNKKVFGRGKQKIGKETKSIRRRNRKRKTN